MIDINDPLQLAIEKLYEDYPDREEDIRNYLLGDEVPRPSPNRGVKRDRGRPRVNKSILAGWVICLGLVLRGAETITKSGSEGTDLKPEFRPSKKFDFDKMAELGLEYTILDDSNLTPHPLANANTLKGYDAFFLSGDLHHKDFNRAVRTMSIQLSSYFQALSVHALDYVKIVAGADEEENLFFQMKYTHLLLGAEPWRRRFDVRQDKAASGPGMILHFLEIEKATWQYLKSGYELLDSFHMNALEKHPPSKDAILAFREHRKSNPLPNYRDLYEKELARCG